MTQVLTPPVASEIRETVESGEGMYVYGVVRPRNGDASAPARMSSDMRDGVWPGAPIETLVSGDLTAVLSPVPLAQFDQAALERNLQEPHWVRDRVIAHQTVLLGLLAGYTVAPLKFCTVYRGRERVASMLADNREAFDRALRQLQGATEWGVKVYCNLTTFAHQLEATSEALQAQREAVARSKPGTAYFLRKKLEQAALRESERAVIGEVQAAHVALRARARAAVVNQSQTAAEHGRTEEMFLNAAYLVEDAQWPAFRAILDALTASLGLRGFQIELTGPWPAYNFVSTGEAQEATHG